jgi:DNA invertase Pin-like site-specific DNA recombinase
MSKQTAPRVYSYRRFSSPEQSQGDSERRQDDIAKVWAQRKGYVFDESLMMIDRGLSGFKGHHRKKGALGCFLEKVKSGEVPPGSILCVENIDRLSREGVLTSLQKIIFEMIDHDIVLQTLVPEATYDRASLNGYAIYELIGQLKRAHEESERKSRMISAARDTARNAAREVRTITTSQCPKWLWTPKLSEGQRVIQTTERRFKKIPEAVKTVQMIFDMKLKGMGTMNMVRQLNATAPWKPKPSEKSKKPRKHSGWSGSYIKKILSNRAVLGEYQPFKTVEGTRRPEGEPIPNYYPRIIEDDIFDAVQAKFAANKGKGGRRGKSRNLLTHIVKCAYCGGSMMLVDKGDPPKGGRYLVCYNAHRGVCCERHLIRYEECEQTILDNCHKLRPEQVLPNPSDHAKHCEVLRLRVNAKSAALTRLEEKERNLIDAVSDESDAKVRAVLKHKLGSVMAEKKSVESELADSQKELRFAENAKRSFESWKSDLAALRNALEQTDVRLRLQSHLRELVERIDVFPVGYLAECDDDRIAGRGRDGESIRSAMHQLWNDTHRGEKPGKDTLAFWDHVTARFMSKDGRFLRVRFKTGSVITMVPKGSVAHGTELRRGDDGRSFSWLSVMPKWEDLRAEYENSKRKKGNRKTRTSVQRGAEAELKTSK